MGFDLKITDKDMMSLMKASYEDDAIRTLDQMIKHLRYVEERYKKGESEHSGLLLLGELLKQGTIKMDMYLKIREIVENYNTPYEIVLLKKS